MIKTLPNLLTLSRIAVIPVLIAAFYLPGHLANWVTFGLFVAACITDFLDGYVARSRDQHTSLGRFLDPLADKLLVAACIVLLVATDRFGAFTVLAALVIVCREILVSGLRAYLAELDVGVPVSRLAKWKTTLQMVAIAALLLGDAAPFALPATTFGVWALWAAAALTLYTGYDYLRAGLPHLMHARTDAARPQPAPQPAPQSAPKSAPEPERPLGAR